MNRMDATFRQLRKEGRTALMPFLTIGDPNPRTSVDIIMEAELAGADIIELGVPYSDPLADGEVIQRASGRALEHQVTILECIEIAGRARERGAQLPFILFTYYNPVLQVGLEKILEKMVSYDISGLLVPDLPHEEDAVVREAVRKHGIHLIPLVAPTSQGRIQTILDHASGFIYCVSSLGVTGVRSEFHQNVGEFLATVKNGTELPIAIGFGISNREQVSHFANSCDGVIVGSAIVRKIEENLELLESEDTYRQGLDNIRNFIAELKSGT